MAKYTLIGDDEAGGLSLTAAAESAISVERVVAAYRYLDPGVYEHVDSGQKDSDGKPVMYTLTDADVWNKIAAVHLTAILENTLRGETKKVADEAAKASASETTAPLFTPIAA